MAQRLKANLCTVKVDQDKFTFCHSRLSCATVSCLSGLSFMLNQGQARAYQKF